MRYDISDIERGLSYHNVKCPLFYFRFNDIAWRRFIIIADGNIVQESVMKNPIDTWNKITGRK